MGSDLMVLVIAFGVSIVVAVVLRITVHRLQMGRSAQPEDVLDPTTQALLESIPMPAVVYGASLRRTYVNPAYVENAGLVRRVSRQEWFQRALVEAFLNGEATSRPSSPEYPEDIHVMPLRGSLVVAIVIDQSERHQTASMREDFIANASHELNTPAAAISLLAEALAKTVKKGSRAEAFAESLVLEAGRLSALTRDIVRLSEAQRNLEEIPDTPVDLLELVAEVVDAHVALAEQVGVSLLYGPPAVVEDEDGQSLFRTRGNPQQVEVAIANLVENAIQHSPKGAEVRVDLVREGDSVEAVVTDHGPGIPKGLQEQIFQRFFRTDSSRSRKAGGTGLGLSISRNTARALGGDVTVKSSPGEGAQFAFRVPSFSTEEPTHGELGKQTDSQPEAEETTVGELNSDEPRKEIGSGEGQTE